MRHVLQWNDSATKKPKTIEFAGEGMELEKIVLSSAIQVQMGIACSFS